MRSHAEALGSQSLRRLFSLRPLGLCVRLLFRNQKTWSAPARRSPPTVVAGVTDALRHRSQASLVSGLDLLDEEQQARRSVILITGDVAVILVASRASLRQRAPASRSSPEVEFPKKKSQRDKAAMNHRSTRRRSNKSKVSEFAPSRRRSEC